MLARTMPANMPIGNAERMPNQYETPYPSALNKTTTAIRLG